ncbi:MAG: hypothetical protein AAF639_38045 [Chloroflexota bacterium]
MPIVLVTPSDGEVGRVGEIEVLVSTGEINTSEVKKEELLLAGEQLADTLPPYEPEKLTDHSCSVPDLEPTHTGPPIGNPLEFLPKRN